MRAKHTRVHVPVISTHGKPLSRLGEYEHEAGQSLLLSTAQKLIYQSLLVSVLKDIQFIGWVVFNVLMVPILYVKPEKMQWVVAGMNMVTAVTLISMCIWIMVTAGGGGPLLSQPATALSNWDLGWSMVHGVTTVIGGIAVGLTNQMDYSRFARRPGDQVMGQWLSIIVLGVLMPALGCLSASASQGVYGEAIW